MPLLIPVSRKKHQQSSGAVIIYCLKGVEGEGGWTILGWRGREGGRFWGGGGGRVDDFGVDHMVFMRNGTEEEQSSPTEQ